MPTFFIWLPVLLLAAVAGLMLWRRSYREFPFFFVYVLYATLVGLVRYAAYAVNRELYFYVYWTSELGGAVATALPLYEVFLRRVFSGFSRVRFYRNLFPAIAVAVLILTVLSAAHATDRRAAFLSASRAFDFARTAFLVFFISLMLLMGRSWTRYNLGIVMGFGLQAAVALLNAAVRYRLHYVPTILDTGEVVAYYGSCLIWLITFWKAEQPAPVSPDNQISPEMVEQARGWESSLKDFFRPKKPKL